MSTIIIQCINVECVEEIDEKTLLKIKTSNSIKLICHKCRQYRWSKPIHIKCKGCATIFELVGNMLRLFCTDKCRKSEEGI